MLAGPIHPRCAAGCCSDRVSSCCGIGRPSICAATVRPGRCSAARACWPRRRSWCSLAQPMRRASSRAPGYRSNASAGRFLPSRHGPQRPVAHRAVRQGLRCTATRRHPYPGRELQFPADRRRPSVAEHQANLEMLEQISTDLYQRLQADPQRTEALQGRVAFRCTSPDYLPLIGPLADPQRFAETYAALARERAAVRAGRLPLAGRPLCEHRPRLARHDQRAAVRRAACSLAG